MIRGIVVQKLYSIHQCMHQNMKNSQLNIANIYSISTERRMVPGPTSFKY